MVDYQHAVKLVIKLFGVILILYGAVSTASYFPSVMQSWDQGNRESILWYFLPVVTPFLIGLLLWLFPATVTNTIVSENRSLKGKRAEWAPEIERIGVSLLGIYLLYRSITNAAYQVTYHRAKVEMLGSVRAPDDFGAIMTSLVLQIVLAVILVLGSGTIVKGLRKLRYVATS